MLRHESANNGTYEILIEMPRGESRRLHIAAWGKRRWIDLGPIINVIPVNNGVMPIDYGFVIGTKVENNGEADELDALVYSKKKFSVGERVKATPIASMRIGDRDHKVIFTDESTKIKTWEDIPEIKRKILLEYFGYKSKVRRMGDKDDAISLIRSCRTDAPLSIPRKVIINKIGVRGGRSPIHIRKSGKR